jgi:hypothetical protein
MLLLMCGARLGSRSGVAGRRGPLHTGRAEGAGFRATAFSTQRRRGGMCSTSQRHATRCRCGGLAGAGPACCVCAAHGATRPPMAGAALRAALRFARPGEAPRTYSQRIASPSGRTPRGFSSNGSSTLARAHSQLPAVGPGPAPASRRAVRAEGVDEERGLLGALPQAVARAAGRKVAGRHVDPQQQRAAVGGVWLALGGGGAAGGAQAALLGDVLERLPGGWGAGCECVYVHVECVCVVCVHEFVLFCAETW